MGRADNENVGIAFALVSGAGAATGLGAAVVFVPALVKLASRKTLASALGLSAGVMTYVSFVEIFAKSTSSFEDAGHDEDKAYILATLCFFGGVILMVVSVTLQGIYGRRVTVASWWFDYTFAPVEVTGDFSVLVLTLHLTYPFNSFLFFLHYPDPEPNGNVAFGGTSSSP